MSTCWSMVTLQSAAYFFVAVTKYTTEASQGWKWLMVWGIQSTTAEKSCLRGHEEAGRIPSTVRKQRVMVAAAQSGALAHGMVPSTLREQLLCQLNLFGKTLLGMCRGVSSRWFLGLVKLTMKVSHSKENQPMQFSVQEMLSWLLLMALYNDKNP